ncbi:MAG: DUF222 domain-containing protein [Cryobacterium sp.]
MELIDEYMASPGTESGVASGDRMAELVDVVAATDRMLAAVSAMRADAIDQMRVWSEKTSPVVAASGFGGTGTMARRSLVAELACALRIPEGSAERLLAESETLVHDLAATRTALQRGEISYRHAKTLIDHAWSLPKEERAGFESAVLPDAKRLTVAKFDGTARKARESSHPDTITARHEKCSADRHLQLLPARDGMAWLNAYLSAADANAVFERVSAAAQGLQGGDEARTLTQLRADVFTDVLIDGVTPSGLGRGIRASVNVTVPVMTLLGHSEEPGHLEGYGPIDPDTARRLAGHAPSFTRILTHPETGCVLSVGRSRYKVPKDLRRWLRLRDETCRHPGCNRSAARCDLDHSGEWQDGGRTRHDNLAHLCGPHHRLKSEAGWSVIHARDGTLTWTSPSGKRYVTEPATRIDPAPPF